MVDLKNKKTSATFVEKPNDIKVLCDKLANNVEYLKQPKCARYIRARKIKRDKLKNRTQTDFYNLKFDDFIRENNVFGGKQLTGHVSPVSISPKGKENFDADLDLLNKHLFELQELANFQTTLTKLTKLRISASSNFQNASSIPLSKLEEVVKMMDERKSEYEKAKSSMKSNK